MQASNSQGRVGKDAEAATQFEHQDGWPSPASGENSRGGKARHEGDLRITGGPTRRLKCVAQNYFRPWRERQQGMPEGQLRVVPERGNPNDSTAVGVWLDSKQVGYIYPDEAETYTVVLSSVGLNLRVEGERSDFNHDLYILLPTPASIKRVSKAAIPIGPQDEPDDPRQVAEGRALEVLRLPAQAGRWSLPEAPPWPVGYRPESNAAAARADFTACPLCEMPFDPKTARFSNETLNKVAAKMVCPQCFDEIGPGGRPYGVDMPAEVVISTLQQYYEITGHLPRPGGADMEFIDDYPRSAPREEMLNFLRLVWSWPNIALIRSEFGDWQYALSAAGLLGRQAEPTTRGVRSVAADGHECFSYGERILDDWLHSQGIDHEREPPYPGTNYRGDFLVGDVIVEFLGLKGDPAYDAKTASKREVAARLGLRMIEVTPLNLGDWKGLSEQLGVAMKRWRPAATAVPAVSSSSSPSPQLVVSEPAGWFPDPFAASHKRYFDGAGWTHHTLTAEGAWMAHTPWGDSSREEAQAWVARRGRIREAPLAANGKFGNGPEGLSFWLAAIDEYENGNPQGQVDSAFESAYRGFILYTESSGPAMMAVLDRCARFDRARARTMTNRVLSIFAGDGCEPDFAAVGLSLPQPAPADEEETRAPRMTST